MSHTDDSGSVVDVEDPLDLEDKDSDGDQTSIRSGSEKSSQDLRALIEDIRRVLTLDLDDKVSPVPDVGAPDGRREEFVNKIVVNLERVLVGLDTRITIDPKSKEPSKKEISKPIDLTPVEDSLPFQSLKDTNKTGRDFFPHEEENVGSSFFDNEFLRSHISQAREILESPHVSTEDLKQAFLKEEESELPKAIPDRDWMLVLLDSLNYSTQDDKDNYWVKVPLRPADNSMEGLDRLHVPSDTRISYKLTVRSVLEAESLEEEEQEAASSVSVVEYERPTEMPMQSIRKVIQSEIPFVLNEVQVAALQCLYNLGLDLEDSGLIDLLNTGDRSLSYDWETLVTRNRLVGIPPLRPFQYERDRTRRSPEELNRAVKRYIAQVFALKYRNKNTYKIHLMEKLIRMKKDLPFKAEEAGKVVVRITYPKKKRASLVRYAVLSKNTSLHFLKELVKKHLLGCSREKLVELFLSDNGAKILEDQICVGDLCKIDEAYLIISLRASVEQEVIEEEVEPSVSQEPCKPYVEQSVKGYRNTTTNVVYYHACSQTSRPVDLTHLVSREVQTPALPLRDVSTSSVKERWTQMPRDDYLVDERKDRILCAKPWVLDPAYEPEYREAMAKRIQRQWRNYLITRCEQDVRGLVTKFKDNEETLMNRMGESLHIRQMKQMLSPLYLNKKEDSYMLYVFLENWWTNVKKNPRHRCAMETLRRKTKSEVKCRDLEKTAASGLVVEEFQRLLEHLVAIEKNMRKRQNPDGRSMKLLNESTKPVMCKDDKGTIETVESQRAVQLKRLYETLQKRDLTLEERVDLLLHIKQLLLNESREPVLTEKLLSLIHKEVDYLNLAIARGPRLDTLRQRIELHFLKYITSREVNPNINKILDRKRPQELQQCYHCLRLKRSNQFQTELFSESVLRVCKDCFYLREIGKEHLVDYSKYSAILTLLRQEEIRKCTLSPLPFLISEETVHIILTIWGFHSPISACRDLSKLRLVRWITHHDWTPWNNILLTEEEVLSHTSVKQVYNVYSSAFIHQVWRRNTEARRRFESLRKMEYCMKHILALTCRAEDVESVQDEISVEKCLYE